LNWGAQNWTQYSRWGLCLCRLLQAAMPEDLPEGSKVPGWPGVCWPPGARRGLRAGQRGGLPAATCVALGSRCVWRNADPPAGAKAGSQRARALVTPCLAVTVPCTAPRTLSSVVSAQTGQCGARCGRAPWRGERCSADSCARRGLPAPGEQGVSFCTDGSGSALIPVQRKRPARLLEAASPLPSFCVYCLVMKL